MPRQTNNRFDRGHFVSTSAIDTINDDTIRTAKGSKYIVVGVSKEFEADITEVELLEKATAQSK